MKSFNLICVGKLKNKSWQEIEANYLQRIKDPMLKIIEVKSQAESPEKEGKEIIKVINRCPKPFVVLLDEQGSEYSSQELAIWLNEKLQINQDVFLVVGGAQGHHQIIKSFAHEKISLSPLTLPHQLARLLFIEQFYRAQTILTGHPYHNQ